MMGRVEGKVDTLISMQSAVAARVDGLEVRMTKGEVDIATLRTTVETSKNTNQSTFANATAIIATIIAAVSTYLSYRT